MLVNKNERLNEVLLVKAIRKALAEVLGETTAGMVEFYVDPSMAAVNIDQYGRCLQNFFRGGATMLEEKCAEKLYAELGLEFQVKKGCTLEEYFEDILGKLSHVNRAPVVLPVKGRHPDLRARDHA